MWMLGVASAFDSRFRSFIRLEIQIQGMLFDIRSFSRPKAATITLVDVELLLCHGDHPHSRATQAVLTLQ